MQDSPCGSSIRLGIAPGVPSRQLSSLLALQREEEPETPVTLSEVAGDALVEGLRDGRYDMGLALQDSADACLSSQSLWREEMVVAMPLRYPLLNKAVLTLDDVLNSPIFRWQAETCPVLDQRMMAGATTRPFNVQYVPSFELLALWVAAGYGIGMTAQSRIAHARAWDMAMRPFADAPFEIMTHLVWSTRRRNDSHERFGCRAVQMAGT